MRYDIYVGDTYIGTVIYGNPARLMEIATSVAFNLGLVCLI